VVGHDGAAELRDRRHHGGGLRSAGAGGHGLFGGGRVYLEPPGWAGGGGEGAERGDRRGVGLKLRDSRRLCSLGSAMDHGFGR